MSWAKPRLRVLVGERHRARSSQVDLSAKTTLAAVETDMQAVVAGIVTPLYERFDGYRPPYDLVADEIADLRRHPSFEVVTS